MSSSSSNNNSCLSADPVSQVFDVQKLLNRLNSNGSDSSDAGSNLLKSKLVDEYNDSSKLRNAQPAESKTCTLYEKNLKSHYKVIRFIVICGKKLELSDLSLASATVIYNKFFYTCELTDFDPYLIATSAIYLASKVEEDNIKLRDVINVCYRTLHPKEPALELSEKYMSLRNSVTQCELLLVRMLEFKLNFDHPHKYLLNYLESLRHWIPLDIRERTPVPETCWIVLRDILHSNLTLKHRPQEIALAIIYLVLISYGVKVPFNDIAQKSWWKALDDKITRTKIHLIIQEIISVYEMDEALNLDNVNFI